MRQRKRKMSEEMVELASKHRDEKKRLSDGINEKNQIVSGIKAAED